MATKANTTTDENELTVEVFDGAAHTREWPRSEADIAEIASNYSASAHEAPVTLDHAQDGPAHGWVKGLVSRGTKLVALLGDLSPALVAAIRDRRFDKRSVELYPRGNKPFAGKPMLRAVSFLGSQIPECKGLAPIEFAETDFGEGYLAIDCSASSAQGGKFNKEESNMDQAIAELTEKFSEATSRIAALDGELATARADLAALRSSLSEREATIAKFGEERRAKVVEDMVSRLEAAGKVVPATRAAAVAYLTTDDEAVQTARFAEAEGWPVIVVFGEDKSSASRTDTKVAGSQESAIYELARQTLGIK